MTSFNYPINRGKLSKFNLREARNNKSVPFVIINPVFGEELAVSNSINLNGNVEYNLDSGFDKSFNIVDKLSIGYQEK
jgi:hypothetical protein